MSAGGATAGLNAAQTAARESKVSKIVERVKMSLLMIFTFFGIIWLGHTFLVGLIILIQVGCFRELVNVRYQREKEKKCPLFRTIQWSAFCLAMGHNYGKQLWELGLIHSSSARLPLPLAERILFFFQHRNLISLTGYVTLFVTFVVTLRKDILKYQIGNAVWTGCLIVYVVKQVQGATMLIFSGIYWFILPCGLVVANDCFAYICGMTMGGRFARSQYTVTLDRSENQPLGLSASARPGALRGLAVDEVSEDDKTLVGRWNLESAERDDQVVVEKGHILERVNGESIRKELPPLKGKVELRLSKRATFLSISPNKTWEGFTGAVFCTVLFAWFAADFFSRFQWIVCPQREYLLSFSALNCEPSEVFIRQRIVAGVEGYTFFTFQARWVQMHTMILALLASLVAPFGGFLASGIKRAYKIKDFGDLIPGHGGFMDRMDCQLLMLFSAHVYYQSIVLGVGSEEERILTLAARLPLESKERIYRQLGAMLGAR